MISLSQFLKYKRQFKGLSLSQMASYLGISPRTYQKIEHDEPVRISVLKSVLDSTRFDAWDLFSLKENKKTLATFFSPSVFGRTEKSGDDV